MADWGVRDPAWRGIESELLDVRGRPVHVLRRAGEGGGPPQLLVHGLGGSARNWLEVIGALAAHGDVLAVDLPGFGDTPVPEGGSARVRANAGFVGALVDELGWDRFVLHGGSMGGIIATLVAARLTDSVSALVLVNPALPAPRRQQLRVTRSVATRILPAALPGFGRAAFELDMRRKTPEQLADESLVAVFGDPSRLRPAMREVLVENIARAKELPWRRSAVIEAAASVVAMNAEARELNAAVAAVQAPTLLVWGDADQLVSTHVIAGLAERRPDWTQHVFEGVGHTPMVEVPDRYIGVVARWYERVGVAA